MDEEKGLIADSGLHKSKGDEEVRTTTPVDRRKSLQLGADALSRKMVVDDLGDPSHAVRFGRVVFATFVGNHVFSFLYFSLFACSADNQVVAYTIWGVVSLILSFACTVVLSAPIKALEEISKQILQSRRQFDFQQWKRSLNTPSVNSSPSKHNKHNSVHPVPVVSYSSDRHTRSPSPASYVTSHDKKRLSAVSSTGGSSLSMGDRVPHLLVLPSEGTKESESKPLASLPQGNGTTTNGRGGGSDRSVRSGTNSDVGVEGKTVGTEGSCGDRGGHGIFTNGGSAVSLGGRTGGGGEGATSKVALVRGGVMASTQANLNTPDLVSSQLPMLMKFPMCLSEFRRILTSMERLQDTVSAFKKFVPATVVDRIIMGVPHSHTLFVAEKSVTIMFSDIAGFTKLAQSLPLETVMLILEDYLTAMAVVIESHGGTIGDFIGDGIMAFFNSPDDIPNHPAVACQCVLAQKRCLAQLNERWVAEGLPRMRVRFGLHTGSVLTGNIGSPEKMKFGVVGDPVNLASRLEQLCSKYGADVLISDDVYQSVSDLFLGCPVDWVSVAGRSEATLVYELVNTWSAATSDEKTKVSRFVDIFTLYREKRFSEAAASSAEFLRWYPSHRPCQLVRQRASRYTLHPPSLDWATKGVQLSKLGESMHVTPYMTMKHTPLVRSPDSSPGTRTPANLEPPENDIDTGSSPLTSVGEIYKKRISGEATRGPTLTTTLLPSRAQSSPPPGSTSNSPAHVAQMALNYNGVQDSVDDRVPTLESAASDVVSFFGKCSSNDHPQRLLLSESPESTAVNIIAPSLAISAADATSPHAAGGLLLSASTHKTRERVSDVSAGFRQKLQATDMFLFPGVDVEDVGLGDGSGVSDTGGVSSSIPLIHRTDNGGTQPPLGTVSLGAAKDSQPRGGEPQMFSLFTQPSGSQGVSRQLFRNDSGFSNLSLDSTSGGGNASHDSESDSSDSVDDMSAGPRRRSSLLN
eukprot:Rmarinus@m.14734